MFQQILALIIIAFFVSRLIWQRRKDEISNREFIFWLFFWFVAGGAILSLKWIDTLVAKLGFSGKGIEVLLYLGVALAFYLIFKMRIKLEKMDRNLTQIVREIAIREKK